MIEFKNVVKKYDNNEVISDQSFSIEDGELFVIVGQSGSGKTTTLKMINRLIEQTSGEILVNKKKIEDYDLRELRLDIGYVLQSIALFPNLTVGENIELIPEMKKWSKDKRREKVRELLKKVDLDPGKYINRYPKELSGGEGQRVGILRAIIAEPKILLMDEPFSALDPISRKQLQELTINLHKELGITIIFVTHDMTEAQYIADRICVMKNGKILQIGTAEQIKNNPSDDFVKDLFKGSGC